MSKALELMRQALKAKNANIIVARKCGRVVGAASYRVEKNAVKLISIGSLERGVGRKLVDHIRSRHPDLLCIWCKGRAQASGFYESLGWKRGLPVAVGNDLAYIYTS